MSQLVEPERLPVGEAEFPEFTAAQEFFIGLGSDADGPAPTDGLAFDADPVDLETARETIADDPDATGSGTTLAVIDTGLEYDSGMFGRETEDGTETRVLDSSTDFTADGDPTVGEDGLDAVDDGNGHGTHVAATAASGDTESNRGVAPECDLLIMRALDDDGGGAMADIAAAVELAVDEEADAICMCLGCPFYSEAIADALERAAEESIPAVVASGNDRYGTRFANYPASQPGTIGVSATNVPEDDPDDVTEVESAAFANIGPATGTQDFSEGATAGVEVDLAAPGMGIDVDAVGSVVGLVVPLLVAGVIGAFVARSVWIRVTHLATAENGQIDYAIEAYLLARYCLLGVGLAALPLIPVYLAVLLVEGRLWTIVSAFLAAEFVVQLVVILPVLALVAVVAYLTKDAADDVQAALAEAFARQAVRVRVFKHGLTVGGVLFGYTIVWTFSRSVGLAVVLGVVCGVIVYGGYVLIDRASYRIKLFSDESTWPKTILVEAYELNDDDGAHHFVAQIDGGVQTSRESIEDVVEEAVVIAEALGQGERSAPATIGQHRADDLLELGKIDGDLQAEIREQIRKVLVYEIWADGTVEIGRLKTEMDKWPEERWRAEIRRLELLGFVSIRDDTIHIERDPWGTGRYEPAERWARRAVF